MLRLRNLGPVAEANLDLGDLTVFVGAQASGKSITLQTLKLLIDKDAILRTMGQYGLVWNDDPHSFFDLYYGEGMRSMWRESSRATWNDEPLAPDAFEYIRKGARTRSERVAYIPAQRVMSVRDGWTRPFGEYDAGNPYVLREFSQRIHEIVQGELSTSEQLFPREQRFNAPLRRVIDENVLAGWQLYVDTETMQKRFKLRSSEDAASSLSFLTWSAGQREFVPLLLGLYWLMPAGGVKRRGTVEWVIIEEPEMALHPRAVAATMMFVLELLRRGYRVVLSTHSTQVLDVVWGLRRLIDHRADPKDVLDMLSVQPTRESRQAGKVALESSYRAYYFERGSAVRDISGLDPDAGTEEEAGWGGLTSFSEDVANVVARVVRRSFEEKATE